MLALAAPNLYAIGRLQGFVEKGGQRAVTDGHYSSTRIQQSYPSATVTVYLSGSTTLATIYSDQGVTLKANPFTADTTGFWAFYANDGDYDVTFSGTGISTFTLSALRIVAGTGSNFNASDFGVVCDGTTDNTTAFTRVFTAVNAVSGGIIDVPAGTCLTGTIDTSVFLSNTWVRGKGIGATILKLKASSTLGLLRTLDANNVTVSDLTIDGNKANQSATASGLEIYRGSKNTVRNVYIHDTAGIGLVWGGSQYGLIENTTVSAANREGFWIGNFSGTFSNYTYVIGSRAISNGFDGFSIASSDVHFDSCVSNLNGTILPGGGFYGNSDNPYSRITIENSTIIGNLGSGIDFNNPGSSPDSYDNIFSGNTVSGNGAAGIFSASNGTIINGNIVTNNGAVTPADAAGILIDGKNFVVTNNFCNDTNAGGAKVQAYGVRMRNNSGVTANCVIRNNYLIGNLTGPFLSVGTGNSIASNGGTTTTRYIHLFPYRDRRGGAAVAFAQDIHGTLNNAETHIDQADADAAFKFVEYYAIVMPPDWDGVTLPKIAFLASSGAAGNNYVWRIHVSELTDAQTTAIDRLNSTSVLAAAAVANTITKHTVTFTGAPVAGRSYVVNIGMDSNNASDTNTGTRTLWNAWLEYESVN